MKVTLSLQKITHAEDLAQSWALYRASFPDYEQRLFDAHAAVLADSDYCFCHIMEGEDFVGLIAYWQNDDFAYIEHFAIEPERRGGGLGKRVLQLLMQGLASCPIILEIDPPEDEISQRRQGFYERLGFVLTGYTHMHPAYHVDCPAHLLHLMSTTEMGERLYSDFLHYLHHRVLR